MKVPLTAAVLSVLACAGCLNPFAPKLGDAGDAGLCSDLKSVENVFCAFRDAYAFKDTTLYGAVIAPSFTFVYTDYDRAVDVAWGRDDEMRTTYGLFQSVQSLALTWNDFLSSEGDDTLWRAIRGFNLTVTFNPSDVQRVDGYANFTLAREGSGADWRIVRWRDESNY
jgi:hypothetical protein